MLSENRVISVNNKSELCNYGSHLAHSVHGPGLNEIQYGSGRLWSGQKAQGGLALLLDSGEVIEANRTRCMWRPWGIEAEFEFPNAVRVSQYSWVESPFIHSSMTLKGSLPAGAKLIAEGASYQEAKVLVSPDGTVLLDEMDPALKPSVLQISSSINPDRVMVSTDGKNWRDSDYAWSEQMVHYRMVFDHLPREMVMSAHWGKLSNYVRPEEWQKSRTRRDDVKREWLHFYSSEAPDVDCPDPKYRQVVQYCFYVHRSNMLNAGGMLPYPFSVPSKFRYPAWWMWDTGFHSMMDGWFADPTMAIGNLMSHAVLQTRKGCIPDAAGEYYADTGKLEWVNPEQYDDKPPPSTGPPMTGIAAWDVYQKTGSLEFVKRFYPHLVHYERFLVRDKNAGMDPDLIAYHTWCDVGWDDSKRWGKSGFRQNCDWGLPVIPPDGNTFFLILRETLAKFAERVGERDRATEYREKAERTRKAIDTHLWNDKEGFYFDRLPSGRMLDVWTPAGLVPVLARVPDQAKFKRMREHLLNPRKFWTKYPLPTLAMDDPDLDYNRIWWLGGTWPVVNWQVGEGLFHYDPKSALELTDRSVEMMTKDGRLTCTEYYTPTEAEAKAGADNGFSAMPADLVLRRVFGLNPHPDSLELAPHLPMDWPEASAKNVSAAGTIVDVKYARTDGKIKAVVKNTGKKEIRVSAGSDEMSLEPGREATLVI